MRRFSDRLTSTSAGPPDQGKAVANAVSRGSDESITAFTEEAMGPSEHEYAILVEMLGLHQTVKALEAEYCALTGGDAKVSGDCKPKSG